jgi:hypothetical protein
VHPESIGAYVREVQESNLADRESTHHGTALVEINSVRLKLRLLLRLIWILKREELAEGQEVERVCVKVPSDRS